MVYNTYTHTHIHTMQGISMSIEASGIPVAKVALDKQSETYLTCDTGGLTREDDSIPLNTYAASFVEKRIGQTDYTPGGANTITVTLSVSVPITKRMEVMITIAGLSGATAVSGEMPLLEALDFWGMGHIYMFASRDNGPRGRALWSNEFKTLKLSVEETMMPGVCVCVCVCVCVS